MLVQKYTEDQLSTDHHIYENVIRDATNATIKDIKFNYLQEKPIEQFNFS